MMGVVIGGCVGRFYMFQASAFHPSVFELFISSADRVGYGGGIRRGVGFV